MFPFTHLALLGAAAINVSLASPQNLDNLDFPDPSITLDPRTSTWYAFASHGNSQNVQGLVGIDGTWSPVPHGDVLPVPGDWVNPSQPEIRSPDVQYIEARDSYVLYYTALHDESSSHCIGIATASEITGPYTARRQPFACPFEDGGAIDAAGFYDNEFGFRWVVYKLDGDSKSTGGVCGDGDGDDLESESPIMLQLVSAADGITPFGKPIPILDRDPEIDGPLIDSPSLIKTGTGKEAVYVLFYSSHCPDDPERDVRYATSKHVLGPYTRQGQVLGAATATRNRNFTAPGGASAVVDGVGTMVFHATCSAGRCMHQIDFTVVDGKVRT